MEELQAFTEGWQRKWIMRSVMRWVSMPERPRIPLVFGGGLDRATGVLGASPESMRDLRNVYLYRDKVEVRKGHTVLQSFLDDAAAAVDDICLVHPMQAEQAGVVVGWQDGDREVHVYRVHGTGSGANLIGAWVTLDTNAHEPPRVLAAEQYRKMFLAHDEVVFGRRAKSYYYDPFGSPQLMPLTADLGRGVAGPEGDGFITVNGAHSTTTTTISFAKAAGVNWDAKDGDVVTFAGDDQLYTVVGDVTIVQGTNTDIVITPGLVVALSGGEAVTVRANIRARGVTRYLNYLVNWGYGTGADENRPEIVRVSLAGQPTVLKPEHYFIAGLGDDPVLNALPTNDRLVVFKGAEQYEIVGYDRRTFGIKPGDRLYGLAASRLAISVNGVIYFWSLEGPRRTVGGQSVDLAWPLDIDAPAPSDLAAQGGLADGFAAYLPGRRVVQFIFGARTYNLSLWNPEDPKWSYGELGVPAFAGGLLYAGGEGLTGAPEGYATAVTSTGKAGTTDTLNVVWTNNDHAGDEIIEIWMKPTGGAWGQEDAVSVGTMNQNHDVTGLAAGTDHEIALRFRRGALYTAGYTSGDPDVWPAGAKGTGTTLLTAPVLDSTDWNRVDGVSERGHVTFTPAHAAEDVVVRRDTAEIATVTAATHGGAQYTYYDTGIIGEDTNDYDCLHRSTDTDSPLSNEITQWGGPDQPPTGLLCNNAECTPPQVRGNWTNGDVSLATEVWSRNVTQAQAYELSATAIAAATGACVTPPSATAGDTVGVNVRHKATAFSVDDYSAYAGGTNDPEVGECQTTVPV